MRGRLRRYTYDKLHIHAYTVRYVCKVFRLLDKVTFFESTYDTFSRKWHS